MSCPRCGGETPEVSRFCQACGLDLQSDDVARRKSFAAKPDEPVASFALISTIMPRGSGRHPQTYRIALVIGLTVALISAIFGALPIAILVAAFTVPIVYVVYLYDVNMWEDEPLLVTAASFVLTGALTVVFTLIWLGLRAPIDPAMSFGQAAANHPQAGTFVLVAVVVPIIAMALIQIGPLFLASRTKFDDLMDGLTFGVISGVAYATFDTLVRHFDLLTDGMAAGSDAATWVAMIFLEGLIKPLIIGTAAGIAGAEFSGLGRGYDGFTLRYARGLAEATVAIIAYQAGAYLFSYLPSAQGLLLTLVWGLLILGALILRMRNVLHLGLLEAALEQVARTRDGGEHGERDFCATCEMPLPLGSAFCSACGTAVRAKPRRSPVNTSPAAQNAMTAESATGRTPSQADPPAMESEVEPDTPDPPSPSRSRSRESHPSSQPTPSRAEPPSWSHADKKEGGSQ